MNADQRMRVEGPVPQKGRELLRRLAWLACSEYVGTAIGAAAASGWRVDFKLLNPAGGPSLLLGALITPSARIPLLITVGLAVVYMRTRIPVWTSALLSVGFAIVVYLVLHAWRTP